MEAEWGASGQVPHGAQPRDLLTRLREIDPCPER
ncbi:hypothetical protein Sros_7721 [Streptosporangium roseum DSM 43021]|uniref:Uncharacterized protein n=1 Tax=Streptosporangium roseum (strain ATCC 12428 / DSM 43021 / JCM 3005 / KCTC 9067 / NCIMB 10171 / NRRL 2505 / NI 9100) TaxID=479432 RepID=D2ASR4_STRRD|nr:hypothetical protein Sros_7721 [Streptosporangium roseum DSM 43021]